MHFGVILCKNIMTSVGYTRGLRPSPLLLQPKWAYCKTINRAFLEAWVGTLAAFPAGALSRIFT
jgi:hypothetical protein